MKINITVKTDAHGMQIFDALYAFLQSLNSDNYHAPIEITINAPYQPNDVNILYDYMPKSEIEQELEKYNLVFFCNGSEPLTAATKIMADLINQENVYLITNSYLTVSHPLKHKIVWFPMSVALCRDYWTRNFYPQCYENIKNRLLDRKQELIAINGSVRTNRYYFFNLLRHHIPSILQLSQFGTTVHKLNDVLWESTEDT